jgi:hypothetical protein
MLSKHVSRLALLLAMCSGIVPAAGAEVGVADDSSVQAAVPMFLRPAGQFTTTAGDMARLARFLMSDGRVDGRPFIDPELLQAMGRPEGTEAAVAGLPIGFALGLATRDRHGVVGRCHGGNTVGYRAMLCLFPEQQRAFFISVNADSESADYGQLDQALIADLQVAPPPREPTGVPQVDAAPWRGWYVPAPNRFASFAWLDTTLGAMRLRVDDSRVSLAPLQGAVIALEPASGVSYRAPDRLLPSHALIQGRDGERRISNGTQTWQRIALWRLSLLWASLALSVAGLAWILVGGTARALARALPRDHALLVPLLAVLALLLPLPLFLTQSFLRLGDVTPASVSLAAVTAFLPLAMLAGLWRQFRRRPQGAIATLDNAAMLGVLQFALVLAYWGLLPLRLWG